MGIESEYKADSAVVAGWLLHYHEKKRDFEDALRDYENTELGVGSSRLELVPIRGSLPGDRTGEQAVRLADATARLERQRAWLKLVEDMEASLPPKMRLFLKLRWEVVEKDGKIKSGRYRGRPAWIPYVQYNYCHGVAKLTGKRPEDCWIESPKIFTGFWNRVVAYAAHLAAKRGLV